MRKHGVIVNDVAKRDGGNQNMIVNGFTIPLDFVDNKTLSFSFKVCQSTGFGQTVRKGSAVN